MQIISSLKSLTGAQESWFIQNILFNGIPYSTEFCPKKTTGNAVIYLELYEIDFELIEKIKNAGKKVILYHMGDELGDKNISAYAACDLVIRNYYFPNILNEASLNEKILWAPNGFKTGVGPREAHLLQKTVNRQNLSCFLGWLSNTASFNGERKLFSEAVSLWKSTKKRRIKNIVNWIKNYSSLSTDYLNLSSTLPACKQDIHLLSSSGFSNGYSVGTYAAVMEDSIFAPCPAGNSPETIRLYDALECGCIPISLNHQFLFSKKALGEYGTLPFPILDSWEQLPDFLEKMKLELKADPEKIQEIQNLCIAWWSNYKTQISKKICLRIEELN